MVRTVSIRATDNILGILELIWRFNIKQRTLGHKFSRLWQNMNVNIGNGKTWKVNLLTLYTGFYHKKTVGVFQDEILLSIILTGNMEGRLERFALKSSLKQSLRRNFPGGDINLQHLVCWGCIGFISCAFFS